MVWRDVEIVPFDLTRHMVVVLESDCLAAVTQQAFVRRRWLHHAPARREIADEHGRRTFARYRISQRTNDVGFVDDRAGNVLADALAGDGEAREVEGALELSHDHQGGRCLPAAPWRTQAIF